MSQFIQLLVNGLAVGGVYALVALGFVLVYEATGVVNFAAGQLVMVGSFMAVTTVMQFGLSLIPGYLLALVAMAIVGLGFYALVYYPLRNRPVLTLIIGTVAIGIVMHNAAQLVWGSWPFRLPSPFKDKTVSLLGSVLPLHFVFIIAMTALLILLVYLLLYRTPLGKRMRAVAQDREVARLMGIRADALIAISWVLAAVLAGVAGILIGPVWFADLGLGDQIVVKAFAASVIGGLGNVQGAILGGIFVGLSEVLGASYISSAYKDGFAFLLMILFLLARPQGIFGERIGERG